MYDAYSRMEILLGQNGVNCLSSAKIAVFGLGGAGSYVVEALARCGVGSLTLVDYDTVSLTNINRQLYALQSTVGKKKVQIAKERIRDIDDNILVHTYETFYNEDTAGMFDLKSYDYIVDATDTVQSKILLIRNATLVRTPVISCMDTKNKINPSRFEIADISRVNSDAMAKSIRRELKKQGIKKVKVLFSRERTNKALELRNCRTQADNRIPGSISFVPSVAGLLIAGEVVRDILKEKNKNK
nr:tRNA threonylcarbamoyladenosine dehydratase [uncultured Blautia sp.]